MFHAHPSPTPSFPAGEAQVGVAQRAVTVHEEYRAAQRTTARLTDAGVAGHRIAVVGSGLGVRKRDRGRLSAADVTRRGAAFGLTIGALVGWLLPLFDIMTARMATPWVLVNAAILGAMLGAAVALLGQGLTRGQRWFSQPANVRAQRYEVLVDADIADEAVRLLHTEDGAQPDDTGVGNQPPR